LQGARILFGLIVTLIPSDVPLLIVLDETIERRRGKKIKAKGCYRDAVRSTHDHVITCFGLKWLPLCLIVSLPWCKRSWALPFLTFLQYSKTYDEKRGHRHRTTLDYAKIAARIVGQWAGKRPWLFVADGGFARVELINDCKANNGHLISRLRMDAHLYEEPEEAVPGKKGRKALKGKRISSFKTMLDDKNLVWQEAEVNWYSGQKKTIQYLTGVNRMYKPTHTLPEVRWVLVKDPEGLLPSIPLFSSNLDHDPTDIIETFVKRFSIEILFEEARAHLGMETQRQWSDKAILRSTPLIFSLFSIVCLIALELRKTVAFSVLSSAWYAKANDEATFSDIIAYVRRYCWAERYLFNSPKKNETIQLKVSDFEIMLRQLASSA
jgi:hypothetical protein